MASILAAVCDFTVDQNLKKIYFSKAEDVALAHFGYLTKLVQIFNQISQNYLYLLKWKKSSAIKVFSIFVKKFS